MTLGSYPPGAIRAKDWGAILVALIVRLTMSLVCFKHPNEPVARAMFLALARWVAATRWSIGLAASRKDEITSGVFTCDLIGTLIGTSAP